MDKGTKRTLDLPSITSGVNQEAQQPNHGLKKYKNGTKLDLATWISKMEAFYLTRKENEEQISDLQAPITNPSGSLLLLLHKHPKITL